MNSDVIVATGGEIKSLGSRRIGGYAVLFTGPTDLDQQGEFFSKDTDFWLDSERARRRLLWDHGRDADLRMRKLADAELHVSEKGLWCEAELKRMDAVEERIIELANKGQLGFSSGSASHLVERVQVGDAVEIRSWCLTEISATTTPVEKRCVVQALKSLMPAEFGLSTRNHDAERQAMGIYAQLLQWECEQRMRSFETSQHANARAEETDYYSMLAGIEIRKFEEMTRKHRG